MIKVSAGLIFLLPENKRQSCRGKLSGRSPGSLCSYHWFFAGASSPLLPRLLDGWTNSGVSCGLNAEARATAGDRVSPEFGCCSRRGWMERSRVVGREGSGGVGSGVRMSGSRGWGLGARTNPGTSVAPSRLSHGLWTASATHGGSVPMGSRACASPKPPTLLELRAPDSGFKS